MVLDELRGMAQMLSIALLITRDTSGGAAKNGKTWPQLCH